MKDLSKFSIQIDRYSPIPTYRQLCDQMVNIIQSEEVQIGEFLPTENEICQITGLSRMTVRKSIEQLSQLGLVEAVRGRGTFIVAKESMRKSIDRSIGFALRPERYIDEDPFYSQVLMGVTHEAQKQHVHLAFIKGEDLQSEQCPLEQQALLRQLSGLIIAGQMPKAFLDYMMQIYMPCVFLNYRNDDYPFDTVTSEQSQFGRLLARHLVKLGHKQTLYLSGEADNIAHEDRLRGFYKEFAGEVSILKGGKNSSCGREMIQKALEQKMEFTAVVGGSDLIAIGAMNALQDQGYRIPDEVSVCGIDNVSIAENCRPSLTTVHVEKQEMGIRALQLLLRRLEEPKKIQETIMLGAQLMERQSTGIPPYNVNQIKNVVSQG